MRHSSIRCPLCRAPFSKADIIKPSLLKETVEPKDLTTNSHTCSSGNASSEPKELPVKIRALLPEIHNVITKGEKALIFSNFTSFLDRIGLALTQHDIKYCNMYFFFSVSNFLSGTGNPILSFLCKMLSGKSFLNASL